eukprot:2716025-Rhodomonas_salina.1
MFVAAATEPMRARVIRGRRCAGGTRSGLAVAGGRRACSSGCPRPAAAPPRGTGTGTRASRP